MLIFKNIESDGFDLIKKWIDSDELGTRFLSSYSKDDFVHLVDFKSRYLWMVYKESNIIGFFDFEIDVADPSIGYFTFYLIPEYRGQGIGLHMLSQAMRLPEIKHVQVLEGGVEVENIISQKTLEKAGFVQIKKDEDGMLVYRRNI
jgi:RimJ/RimL family protein N-acetyltransferase